MRDNDLNNNKIVLPKDIKLPEHIGIIMDGNGRWAKKRFLPRSVGHKHGAQTFRKIARYCSNIGIKYLTVYAFSTENWRRPIEEVNALMVLFKEYLEEAISDFKNESMRIKFLGDISGFSKEIQELMQTVEKESANKNGMVLNLAMNYGGRAEIVSGVKKIASLLVENKITIDEIDEKLISDNLYTANQPDPDLIIRPSGEYRTSNFLLWQSAYSEYVIMDDVLWPDFTTDNLNEALLEYSKRNRRFGGV